MAIPTTNTDEWLKPVNQILNSIGQAPVNTLESTTPDVAIAFETLENINREVQAEGWSFNTEFHKDFTPESAGDYLDYILIPDDVLQLKLTNNSANQDYDAVLRRDTAGKRYLYDRQNHTALWTQTTVECDVVWSWSWRDIPIPVQDYITSRSSAICSQRIIGDPAQHQMLSQKEIYNRAQALEYECNQGAYTFFGEPTDKRNSYISYQPYKALKR